MGKITKVNIGLALSKNYDKVTLDIVEDTIEHETDSQLSEEIRKRFALVRREVNHQFENLAK